MENHINEHPFDKVILFDKEGNRQEITAYKIIITSGNVEFELDRWPHPVFQNGIRIGCYTRHEHYHSFCVRPIAANVINIIVEEDFIIDK